MNRKMLLIVLAIIGIPALILFSGMMYQNSRVKADRIKLFSFSEVPAGKTYDEKELQGLPEPVQRYFKYALKDSQPYVHSVHLRHDGQFKTALDKEWINIEGEQHFTVEQPGFLWRGKTPIFSVTDQYIDGRGKLRVSLFNIFTLIKGSGVEYDQGELLRWLGESVWFPTNLLPGPRLTWSPIDENTAELALSYGGQNVSYKISFNAKGQIVQLETRRYKGNEGLHTWIGRVSNYRKIGPMWVPMTIEAFWKLDDGEQCYASFNVKEINHTYEESGE